ncbi:MAG: redox-sensing transcriptional repressor Rex [Thermoguttaceae bacterium]|nr:redox-sensing transcriptional repressor Rex [Thermoguttaceae bacterium]
MAGSAEKSLPVPSILRLPKYLRLLKEFRQKGDKIISCTRIAEEFGQLSVQVRKDLAITGVVGRPKVGYQVEELINGIEHFLGWDHKTYAYLVGVGNLGSAILNYAGFLEHGLKIIAAFDNNPKLIGKKIKNCTVYSISEISKLKLSHTKDVQMGIVTVPAPEAQRIANLLVNVGVRSIWNYAPVRLDLPPDIIYEEVKLSESYAVLSHRLNQRTS